MHVYIYDASVSEKKFAAAAARIETRITDLGLNGKIIRLGMVGSIISAVSNEIKKGAKTIVFVGGIKLLNQGVDALAKTIAAESLGHDTPAAFIPLGRDEEGVGEFLGLGAEEEACNVLSQRRVERFDLGLANNNYFLFSASITTEETLIEIDENYTIEIKKPGQINVVNLPLGIKLDKKYHSLPNDGLLELFISTQKGRSLFPLKQKEFGRSLFPFTKLRLSNNKKPLRLDYSNNLASPVDIKIAEEKINFIVGKDRRF